MAYRQFAGPPPAREHGLTETTRRRRRIRPDEEAAAVTRRTARILVMAAGPALALAAIPASADTVAAIPVASMTTAPQAATTCTEQACTGKRPEQTGCDKDGVTVRTGRVTDTAGKQVGTIELRWSATCGANWARVTSTTGGTKLLATVTRSDGLSIASGFDGTSTWSPMVSTRGHSASATGWIGRATGAVSNGVATPGMHDD